MKALRWLLLGGLTPPITVGDAVLTAVRIGTGLSIALGHGWGKVKDPSGIIGVSESLGFPLPTLAGWMAALSEFGGGILLAVGLLTRPAAFLILVTMSVAIYAHAFRWGDPFVQGWELAFLFWMLALQYVVFGAGRFGVDRWLR
ncbi:DoxX family protein [Phycisphaerales bacterium AB-hyl4]|uniref:DoxX family protein n=1 Tax=Natronomicrosphaera hydrolytica TaxID=3242702 RepID=A0ABV4U005_9BACT